MVGCDLLPCRARGRAWSPTELDGLRCGGQIGLGPGARVEWESPPRFCRPSRPPPPADAQPVQTIDRHLQLSQIPFHPRHHVVHPLGRPDPTRPGLRSVSVPPFLTRGTLQARQARRRPRGPGNCPTDGEHKQTAILQGSPPRADGPDRDAPEPAAVSVWA